MDDDTYLNLTGRRSTHGYGIAQDLAQLEPLPRPPRKPLWLRKGLVWHDGPLSAVIAPWGLFRYRWTLRVKVVGSPFMLRVAQGFTWRMATAERRLEDAAEAHRVELIVEKMDPS